MSRLAASFVCLFAVLLLTSTQLALAEDGEPAPPSASPIVFSDWFTDGALRMELIQSGDAAESIVSLQEIYAEPFWAENDAMLNIPMDYGRLRCRILDQATDTLICTRRFDTMFGEYITTEPARNGIKRAYEMTVRIPTPKKPVMSSSRIATRRISFIRSSKRLLIPMTTTFERTQSKLRTSRLPLRIEVIPNRTSISCSWPKGTRRKTCQSSEPTFGQ